MVALMAVVLAIAASLALLAFPGALERYEQEHSGTAAHSVVQHTP